MARTRNADALIKILRDIGLASLYQVTQGSAETKKMCRMTLSNGVPVAVEIDRETPNIWLLPEDEKRIFQKIGRTERYSGSRGKHSHLQQIREFRGRDILKISIDDAEDSKLPQAIMELSRSTKTIVS